MRAVLLASALLAACTQAPAQPDASDSVVPGTIGVTVRRHQSSIVVSAARAGSRVRVGDVVLRYNGEAIATPRQFYRLVFDSAPGTRARLEVLREGAPLTLEVPVRELDVMPRA
jgi:S1-C subfamily serine protease